ncbi:Fic family protein [Aromatoleum diolicum]|uniref:Fido domain-containing protein n=1 Tax=Aromatoleum diolicum TaxID=75796 RepID=A0ABX1QH96_9RHOO|nr:Fic family protein [Aromatoleum diolicum]NMG77703.1 hypothetical protein [Aromatoleum diolicum]
MRSWTKSIENPSSRQPGVAEEVAGDATGSGGATAPVGKAGLARVAHAQFETIHPFRNGNDHTERLLIPLMLAAEGFPPRCVSGPLYRKRHNYFDALLEVQLRSR